MFAADAVVPSAVAEPGPHAVSSFGHALYPAAAAASAVPDSACPSAFVAAPDISGPSSHSRYWELPTAWGEGHSDARLCERHRLQTIRDFQRHDIRRQLHERLPVRDEV